MLSSRYRVVGSQSPWSRLSRPSQRLLLFCWVAVLALGVVYTVSAFGRYLINDDYQTLYSAWMRSRGAVPGKDFFLASYYLLIDFVAPLFRIGGESWFALYAARLFFVALLLLQAPQLMTIGSKVFGAHAGVLAPVLALATCSMLHRGLDLRPDLITTLLWLVILSRLLSDRPLARKTMVLVGFLLALALLNRFKGAVILPLVAACCMFLAWKLQERPLPALIRAAAWMALGAAALLAAYLVMIAATDGLPQFLKVNRALYRDINALYGVDNGLRTSTLLASLQADWWYWLLAAAGVALRTRDFRRFGGYENLVAAGVLVTALASVALNPAYYPYNLVTLQTLLAFFAAYAAASLLRLVRRRAPGVPRTALAGAIIGLPLLLGAGNIKDVVVPSNLHQKHLATFFTHYLRPDQGVFAMEGVGLFRPSVYHWRIPAILHPRYQRGDWSYARELTERPPEIIVISYRIPGWLNQQDVEFIKDHYVLLTPLVLAPGFDSRGRFGHLPFQIILPGEFSINASGTQGWLLDGARVAPGQRISLAAGPHFLEGKDGRCSLGRYYPPEATRLLANPEGLPYFTAPGLQLPAPVIQYH